MPNMTKARRYRAEQKIIRLKVKLERLNLDFDLSKPERTRQINTAKQTLRKWLREYPDIDPEFLPLIARKN
jgi:hypothetical protein